MSNRYRTRAAPSFVPVVVEDDQTTSRKSVTNSSDAAARYLQALSKDTPSEKEARSPTQRKLKNKILSRLDVTPTFVSPSTNTLENSALVTVAIVTPSKSIMKPDSSAVFLPNASPTNTRTEPQRIETTRREPPKLDLFDVIERERLRSQERVRILREMRARESIGVIAKRNRKTVSFQTPDRPAMSPRQIAIRETQVLKGRNDAFLFEKRRADNLLVDVAKAKAEILVLRSSLQRERAAKPQCYVCQRGARDKYGQKKAVPSPSNTSHLVQNTKGNTRGHRHNLKPMAKSGILGDPNRLRLTSSSHGLGKGDRDKGPRWKWPQSPFREQQHPNNALLKQLVEVVQNLNLMSDLELKLDLKRLDTGTGWEMTAAKVKRKF